ncbi:MAG: iron-sulfur cluster assembly scaffold protein [Candidatus Niyogibacteria bacterium]|nr:iron-sulfur cluster assembly scaffold protein [Candidatus Niyogibacteria bacterium]
MDIYQEHILDHAKYPRNAGVLERPTHRGKAQNPLCGDEAEIFLDVKNGALADIKYEVQGCILSKAALSIVSEHVKGKKIAAITKLGAGDVFKLLGFTPTPSRTKCALFGFEAVRSLLEKKKVR